MTSKRIQLLLTLIVFFPLFQNCGSRTTSQENVSQEFSQNELADSATASKENIDSINEKKKDAIRVFANSDSIGIIDYSIEIERIDSLNFFSVKANSNYTNDNFLKIIDFNEAKRLLQNIAEFDENDLEHPTLLTLRDRTNNTIEIIDSYAFVAYYPKEDILLCEGGHSTDVSFNLKNGEGTEQTGNPDIIKSSPNKKYRLNGHFGGQQCSSYFIQRHFKEELKKIIQLDEEFEKITNIWLCVIGDAFWVSNSTLYLTEDSNFGIDTKYFKIEIIEKK